MNLTNLRRDHAKLIANKIEGKSGNDLEGTIMILLQDYEEDIERHNSISTGVSSGTLLPDGWKVYICTNCQEINVKKDNRQITVDFCDNCEHPLWNDDVD